MGEKLQKSLLAALREYVDCMQGEPVNGLYQMTIDIVEKNLIEFAIGECSGHLSHAAQMLGISRTTLTRKIKQYGISVTDIKDENKNSTD